ncbi:MAG: preprotein translocase subunit SecG [Parcubacteria group bacterium]|nr:preprotein translocase subunit SecG [Parcubacteria group bacterium]
MNSAFSLGQIVTAIVLIVLILLQERSSGLSGVFGGEGGFYQTRRGLEKGIFIGTIVFAVLFAALAILDLIY